MPPSPAGFSATAADGLSMKSRVGNGKAHDSNKPKTPKTHRKSRSSRRQLRLRTDVTGAVDPSAFKFRQELVLHESFKRTKEFWSMFHNLPNELKGRILSFEKEVELLGYSLRMSNMRIFSTKSLLEPWELQ